MKKSRDWLAFRMGAECGRAVKQFPVAQQATLTALYETQRRQLAEIGVRSDWHDGALLELTPRTDIDVRQV